MEINIEDTTSKGNLMGMVSISGLVELHIKGNFIKDSEKEMEHGLEKEEINMRDLTLQIVKMVWDNFDGQMETSIVDNFAKI